MTDRSVEPPRIAKWLLNFFMPDHIGSSGLGDHEELYRIMAAEKGRFPAVLWYWQQVVKSFFVFMTDTLFRSSIMFKNYLMIAFRNIKRNKVYSFINVTGFAIGIACTIVIGMYVFKEISFDKFHEKGDRIYRINLDFIELTTVKKWASSSYPLAQTLLDNYPEVELAVRLTGRGTNLITYGEKSFNESGIITADPDFFNMFTFPLQIGDGATALSKPNSAVISRSLSRKIFGNEDSLGETINVRDTDFTITGILHDIPENSHMQFQMVLSFNTFEESRRTNWMAFNCGTYIVLKEDYNPDQFQYKLDGIVEKYILSQTDRYPEFRHFLQPFNEIYLYSNRQSGNFRLGNIRYVYLFSIVGIIILLISCVNFINLSIASSVNRAKEIGIRKVIGSNRVVLFKQFICESVIFTFLSLFISLILVEIFILIGKDFIGYELSLNYLDNPYVLPGLIGLGLSIGIASGIYPALYLSSLKPVKVLKGKYFDGKNRNLRQNGLVFLQFSTSIFILIVSLIIFNQLEYIKDINIGFNKDQVIVIRNRALGINKTAFEEKLNQYPDIISVSASSSVPGLYTYEFDVIPEGSDLIHFNYLWCDYNFANTMQFEMVEGRFFSEEIITDRDCIVINEEAVRHLGWENPIGKTIRRRSRDLEVIGVMKDFHTQSMRTRIKRLLMFIVNPEDYRRYGGNSLVRIRGENTTETLGYIKEVWESFSIRNPFEFSFLDESIDNLYRTEMQLGTLLNFFTFIALFISGLGLFGLASISSKQRTKEIGIRKVLGASLSSLVHFQIKRYLVLVLTAGIISFPFGYFVMNRWLENFAYRVPIGFDVFILSVIIALILAVLTAGSQTVKAATANPVDSLRYE